MDAYPLPHLEEISLKVRGCSTFSVIDMKSAFLQLPLHEESRHITTFTTEEGLFRFRKVPYGLASAPGVFQKLMSIILANIEGVQCYLDDIIIAGSSEKEHDDRLADVLKRINL